MLSYCFLYSYKMPKWFYVIINTVYRALKERKSICLHFKAFKEIICFPSSLFCTAFSLQKKYTTQFVDTQSSISKMITNNLLISPYLIYSDDKYCRLKLDFLIYHAMKFIDVSISFFKERKGILSKFKLMKL